MDYFLLHKAPQLESVESFCFNSGYINSIKQMEMQILKRLDYYIYWETMFTICKENGLDNFEKTIFGKIIESCIYSFFPKKGIEK